MGYCIIDTPEFIEVHSDMCDKMFERKDDYEFSNNSHYLEFFTFDEVEEFLNDKRNKNKKIIFCNECDPESRDYDEEGDDFYAEFDEDEDDDFYNDFDDEDFYEQDKDYSDFDDEKNDFYKESDDDY